MNHISTNRWQLNRRQILRGAGVTIALPMLECMAAGNLPTPTKPKRSVFLYIPNGVNTLTWQIEKAGKDYELTQPLESLERHRDDVTPISGLHHPKVVGKHHNCDKVWLTGADVPSDGGAFRNTVSADQLMAEVQGKSTRFASLEMAIEGHSLAWSRDGIQIPAERNARNIFNLLFGIDKDSKETIRRRLTRRTSILDGVLEDAQRVSRKLGNHDRKKLDEYLTAVRQVEERTERADSWLDTPKPKVDASEEAKLTRKLDTTQVLWGSGMAYGHSHGNANLPTLLAGGRALGLQHGQHVDFNLPKIGSYNVADAIGHYRICSRPIDADARLSNLLLTMLQRMDVETEHFQDSVSAISEIVS